MFSEGVLLFILSDEDSPVDIYPILNCHLVLNVVKELLGFLNLRVRTHKWRKLLLLRVFEKWLDFNHTFLEGWLIDMYFNLDRRSFFNLQLPLIGKKCL